MKVIVLGSGVIGTSTAWWLRQSGHEVTVVDRQAGAARETSFANGGQISVSYSTPWANPDAPRKYAKWMLRPDAPLLFKLRPDLHQWLWALKFARECLPSRLAPNVRAMVALSTYSRATLQDMRADLGIDYHHLSRGILQFYRDEADFEASQRAADVMRDAGVDRRVISADEVVQIEPALASSRALIVGGDYTSDDESGDVHAFTVALAARAAAAGVEFRFNTTVTRIEAEGGRAQAVEVIDDQGFYRRLPADAFVVAMGSYSPKLLRPLHIDCPVYPAKGYSATFRVLDPTRAPEVSLTDSAHKIVMSRFGDRLRVAGTAEFDGYSRALDPVRCESITRVARELFGDAIDTSDPSYWSGLRPSTPSNVPLVGRSRVSNLFLNTGHGTLGWTMGAGSGRALAMLISGQRPDIDFPFIGL